MAQLHCCTQPNMPVKEGSVTVIGKAITARDYASTKDRARAAYQQKDRVLKMNNFAAGPVQGKNLSGQENTVTSCGIYNASGDSMKLICFKDWHGQVLPFYPQEIGNGQLGLFMHTNRVTVPEGSKAAVVYRVKDENGNESDWMCSWSNPRKKEQSSVHAYTEVGEVGHFTDNMWPIISKRTDEARDDSTDTEHGWLAEVSI